jgi:hypothetical protein
MDAQAELQALTPRHTERVFDVLESLGFDMSDWIATATNRVTVDDVGAGAIDHSNYLAGADERASGAFGWEGNIPRSFRLPRYEGAPSALTLLVKVNAELVGPSSASASSLSAPSAHVGTTSSPAHHST